MNLKKDPRIPDFKIIIDTREQAPLPLPAWLSARGTLHTADYSIAGHENEFAVERKSLQDLVHSVIQDRARFERELIRLAEIPFRRVLVEAPYSSLAVEKFSFSLANPRSVAASVAAFEMRYNIPFVFAGGRAEAARLVCVWAYYYMREHYRK